MSMGFGGFGGPVLFEVLFFLVFAAVIGAFIVSFVRGARQWNKNNHSPRLTVSAVITSKRAQVSGGGHGHHASTRYYIAFQVESGDRIELSVSGADYGMLAEGDQGRLTFQGTRFLSFDRSGRLESPDGRIPY